MKLNYKKLGEFIREVNVRNRDLRVSLLLGVSITKEFIPSIANTIGTDFSNYKVVKQGQFAYGPVTSRNGDKISIALMNEEECIISSSYMVFEVVDTEKLLPEYLMMWFRRPEFDRYTRFKSEGSVREIFSWNELCNIELPIPEIEKQREIVKQYNQINHAIQIKEAINNNLEQQCLLNYIKLLNGYDNNSEKLPEGWKIGCIGDYCDIKSGYAFKSEWWTDCGYKVIKIANIINNTIDLDTCNYVIKEHAIKAKDFYAITGDIMIAMTGATTGKIGMVPYCNDKIVVNQRVGKFFLGNNPIEKSPFLFSTLLYNKVAYYLQPNGTAGSAQDNLSPDDIKQISIVLPAKELINDYNLKFKNLIKVIVCNWAQIRLLKKFNSTILNAYFTSKSGESSSDKLSFTEL